MASFHRKKRRKRRGGKVFCTEYRHWRSGKIMRAADYGYKAWAFASAA